MDLKTLLILIGAILILLEALYWPRVSDRVAGVSAGWLGLFCVVLGAFLLK